MMSHGAITVVNAIPCGIGATVGVDLVTGATFRIRGSKHSVKILNDPEEDTKMAEICVRRTFERFGVEEPEAWLLSVDSHIPIARGLKSSSSACNAIISTVADFITKEYPKARGGFSEGRDGTLEIIRLGVECAREAGVTITGAFDDACGCHFGGLVITDNRNDTIIKKDDVDIMDVILLVPDAKIRKHSVDAGKLRSAADTARELIGTAENDWCSALTRNGALIARLTGVNDDAAKKALSMGALAAGVTGTGPAISVIVKKGEGYPFLKDLGNDGYNTIMTKTR